MSEDASTAHQKAYERIHELILTGKIAPGERLRERNLGALLGLSRTPVREALRRLSSEGTVRFEPNRGVYVEEIDLGELLEIFDIGAALESRCARLAARKIDGEALGVLENCLDGMAKLAGRPESNPGPPDYIRLDKRFHSTIVAATGNRKLQALVEHVVSLPVLSSAFRKYEPEDFQRSVRQHGEILEAIRSGDEAWAEVAMRNHILTGRNAVVKQAGSAGDRDRACPEPAGAARAKALT